jgi:hypothetical protein
LKDGVYNIPGDLIVPAGSSQARFVGHRPGIEAYWQVDRHVSMYKATMECFWQVRSYVNPEARTTLFIPPFG